MSNKILIVGNWKMNPDTLEEAKSLSQKTRKMADQLLNTDVVVCPPFVFISDCSPRNVESNFYMGAQNVSLYKEDRAHTGEVNVSMLNDLNIKYVIVGHSERRAMGETDEDVAEKVSLVSEVGIHSIICIGEKVRDENGQYLDLIKQQITTSLSKLSLKNAKNVIIAYEPIWAIGATEAMKPEQICEMAIFVRKTFSDVFGQNAAMKVKVLYGGSVNAENARDIITIGSVDGLLVGRQSVDAGGFGELLKSIDNR